jgi:acetyltransferase
MVKFHEKLSDRTVYLRYFCSLSLSVRVSHERLSRICFVDYDREMALVADQEEQTTGKHRIMGVGRLIRRHARNEAEVAVLVSDQCQRRGLGTELLSKLVQVARDDKLNRLCAEMLGDNLGMQTIFTKLGFRLSFSPDSASIRATLDF